MQLKAYYISSVENPADVLNGKEPSVKEFGPFYMSETTSKSNVVFNPVERQGYTISYQSTTVHQLPNDRAAIAKLKLPDLYTIVNPAYFKVAKFMEEFGGDAATIAVTAHDSLVNIHSFMQQWQKDFTVRSLPRLLNQIYNQLCKLESREQMYRGVQNAGASYLTYMYLWNPGKLVGNGLYLYHMTPPPICPNTLY
jgi:hypothetical protein